MLTVASSQWKCDSRGELGKRTNHRWGRKDAYDERCNAHKVPWRKRSRAAAAEASASASTFISRASLWAAFSLRNSWGTGRGSAHAACQPLASCMISVGRLFALLH